MKKLLCMLVLGLLCASFAWADDSYYVCFNLDPASKAPANVMIMATPDGLAGLMDAADVEPPRALFQADPVSPEPLNPTKCSTLLLFGPVQWQGGNNGFQDFQSARVSFDAATCAMSQATFIYDGVAADYGKCVVQSDR